MANDATFESDVSIGLSVVLGVLAVGAALAMLAGAGTVTGAFGFAASITLGVVLVVALHAYA